MRGACRPVLTKQQFDEEVFEPVPTLRARDRRVTLYIISAILDLVAIALGWLVALQSRDQRFLELAEQPIVLFAVLVFVMIAIAREVHSIDTLQSRSTAVAQSLGALGATALLILLMSFMLEAKELSRLGFFWFFGAAAGFMVLGKVIVDLLFKQMLGGVATRTVILCDGLSAEKEFGTDRFDVGKLGVWPDPNRPDYLEMLSRLVMPYDRVIVACEYERRAAWSGFLKGLEVGGEILLDRDLLHGAIAIGSHKGQDTIVLSLGPLDLVNRMQKRIFDLLVSGFAIALLWPFLLAIAIGIKLDSPGPVLFRQQRVGRGQLPFDILKFRSMRHESCDLEGARSATRDDDRVTRFGRFLRSTSIDELPQLFNVLRGEMSIVGPRPHALGSRAGETLFWHASEYYWMRHALKPGLTGLAQVRGYRGATETAGELQMRVRSDLEYLATWSLWSDIIIMLRTVRVLVHKNAF